MKSCFILNYFLLALSIIIIESCAKNNSDPDFFAEAMKNGNHWKSDHSSFKMMQGSDSIRVTFYTKYPKHQHGYLTVNNIPLKEGTHDIAHYGLMSGRDDSRSSSLTYIDYDLPRSKYYTDSTSTSSFITIDEISEDRKEIKGIFNVTFILDESYSPATKDHPKIITFSEGTYSSEDR